MFCCLTQKSHSKFNWVTRVGALMAQMHTLIAWTVYKQSQFTFWKFINQLHILFYAGCVLEKLMSVTSLFEWRGAGKWFSDSWLRSHIFTLYTLFIHQIGRKCDAGLRNVIMEADRLTLLAVRALEWQENQQPELPFCREVNSNSSTHLFLEPESPFRYLCPPNLFLPSVCSKWSLLNL